MDGSTFDRLTRSLNTPGSRRRALGGLLVAAFGLWRGLEGDEASAHDALKKCKKLKGDRKKACLKKAKKHNATHLVPPPPSSPCVPSCGSRTCGPDGCGGVCGNCGLCETCQDGSCGDAPNGASCFDGAGPCRACQSGSCNPLPLNTPCPGGYCSGGTCIPCGTTNQFCCPGCVCNAGFVCAGGCGNLCQPCGDVTQLCCPGGACNTGLECRPNGRCEFLCGELGQRCCNDVPKCDSGLTCNFGNSKCERCGGPDERCCNGFCDGGLQCCDSGTVCKFSCSGF